MASAEIDTAANNFCNGGQNMNYALIGRDFWAASGSVQLHPPGPVSCDVYKRRRMNGVENEKLHGKFPHDGTYDWIKGDKSSDGFVYGKKTADGKYEYEVEYKPGREDLAYIAKMDHYYLTDLFKTKELQQKEPKVWYLWEADKIQGKVKEGMGVGDWWCENYCNQDNVGEKLDGAETVYNQLIKPAQPQPLSTHPNGFHHHRTEKEIPIIQPTNKLRLTCFDRPNQEVTSKSGITEDGMKILGDGYRESLKYEGQEIHAAVLGVIVGQKIRIYNTQMTDKEFIEKMKREEAKEIGFLQERGFLNIVILRIHGNHWVTLLFDNRGGGRPPQISYIDPIGVPFDEELGETLQMWFDIKNICYLDEEFQTTHLLVEREDGMGQEYQEGDVINCGVWIVKLTKLYIQLGTLPNSGDLCPNGVTFDINEERERQRSMISENRATVAELEAGLMNPAGSAPTSPLSNHPNGFHRQQQVGKEPLHQEDRRDEQRPGNGG